VGVTDELDTTRAELSVQPSDVTSWLYDHEWQQVGRIEDVAERWQLDTHLVLVPLAADSSDFPIRWREMLRDLADAVGTDESGVLLTIEKADSDIAEFRAVGDSYIDDAIPLGDASMLIDQIHRSMRASANSAVQPRSYFGHSLPDRVKHHADGVRMGQTRRGSYVVPVICRIPMLRPDIEDDQPLFDASKTYQPFARIAMMRLAEGLDEIRSMALEEVLPSSDRVRDSVSRGVSYELSGAIATILEARSVDKLSVNFSWAEKLTIPSVPSAVTLSHEMSPIIRHVSDELRGVTVVGTQTLVGYVKALSRGEDDEIGRVTIRALDEDQARNVALELDSEQYDVASHANNERVPVSVTGRLRREVGRMLRFDAVESFSLIEAHPTLIELETY
jgi:hypothetical protein